MHFNKNIHNMAVLIEFMAGSGLAIFFHLVLHSSEVAYNIFVTLTSDDLTAAI